MDATMALSWRQAVLRSSRLKRLFPCSCPGGEDMGPAAGRFRESERQETADWFERGSSPSDCRTVMASSPSAHQAFLLSRFFGSLDGLRCLSILAVVLHHSAGTHGAFSRLDLGVSLFFAISGFLITTLLLRERDGRGDISLTGFYVRRSLRIFPLYYAVLGLYILLVFFTERDARVRSEFFHHLPAFLTYTSNWFVSLEGRVIFYFA